MPEMLPRRIGRDAITVNVIPDDSVGVDVVVLPQKQPEVKKTSALMKAKENDDKFANRCYNEHDAHIAGGTFDA
jgi:hypothetical protein